MDSLIGIYADKLQLIYDFRTAGEYTFIGVLSEFALKVQAEIASAYVDYTNTPECGE